MVLNITDQKNKTNNKPCIAFVPLTSPHNTAVCDSHASTNDRKKYKLTGKRKQEETGSQRGGQMDGQTDRHTYKQTDGQACGWTTEGQIDSRCVIIYENAIEDL